MKSRVEKLARPAAKLGTWEKLLYVHDFICQNVHYDKLKKDYSHEIIGTLGQGVAVCEGIAKAVKILCDALGIWCIVALSEANPEKGIRYRHAWNVVRVDGRRKCGADGWPSESVHNRRKLRLDLEIRSFYVIFDIGSCQQYHGLSDNAYQ